MEENAYSWENPEYRKTYHHTCSHVMAQAICRLYPGTKLAIGPAIEEGFYYDIDSEHTFSPDDFEAIEKEMRKICKEKLKLERFELENTGADGEKHRPVMIHRVVLGSIERFIGIITEHYAGAFPVWLAPVQVRVLTITDRANEAAEKVAAALDAAGLRVEKDLRNEKIGKKIAEGRSQKIPYLLILGDKEAESGTVAVRSRGGDEGVMALDDFIARVNEEVRAKKN